ncbi:MAG: hypothetical protein ACE5FL_02870 [Myxococcota bacterium]
MARRVRLRRCVAALVGAFASGCGANQAIVGSGLPLAAVGASVSLIAERGDHLDVRSDAGGKSHRFFLPNSESCRALFAGERFISYSNDGVFGRFTQGEASCSPVGILSLAAWRDRGPRRQTPEVIPRSRAVLKQIVYEDDDLTLVRGRFLLANQIGFTGGADSIAVIPKLETCAGVPERETASMEFRAAGKQPFTIVNGSRLCPVLGFVKAPPGR